MIQELKIKSIKPESGFTLLETIIVIAIFLLLSALVLPNSLNFRSSSSINTIVSTFMTDLKNQQIKAMTGDTEGRGFPDTYSIYVKSATPSSYVLFHGQNYSQSDTSNFAIVIDGQYLLSATFPSSKIVFASGSGEILNYVATQSSVTIKEKRTGQQKVIQLNKYGVATSIN